MTGRRVPHGMPPLPDVEPTRRQSEQPQEGPQRNACAGLIDGTQDSQLVGTIVSRSPANVKPETRSRDQSEPEQCREFLDASSECEELLSEFPLGQVRHFQLTTTVGAVQSHTRASTEERRGQWRWSGPRCVERARVVGGRSVAEDGPWSCD